MATGVQRKLAKESVKADHPIDVPRTNWTSIWMATICLFLCGIQFSIFMSSLWPFLREIDDKADVDYLGYIIAAFSIGQLFTSPIFGFVGNKMKTIVPAAAVGTLMQMAGNLLYANAQAFPDMRRLVLLCARLLLGLGAGNASLYRAYIATGSMPADRAKAIAISSGAFSLGIIVGPGLQVLYSKLGFPGYHHEDFHLNMYTAAAYTCAIANLLMFLILVFAFKETYCALEIGADMKEKLKTLPQFDWVAAIMMIGCWTCQTFLITNGESINSPYMMVMFGWSEHQAVLYGGLIQVGGGVFLIIVFLGFGRYLYSRVNERMALALGFIMNTAFYIISFPWPSEAVIEHRNSSSNFERTTVTTTLLPLANATTGYDTYAHLSCSQQYPEEDWCFTTPHVSLTQYMIGWIFSAIGFPIANIVVLTLYSKILGPRRQGTMQGVYMASGSLARAVGPIIIGHIFQHYGPQPCWALMIICMGITTCAIFVTWKRLIAYDPIRLARNERKVSSQPEIDEDTGQNDNVGYDAGSTDSIRERF